MAEKRTKKKKRRKGKSPDPYMRAFLRQAAAIIAAERGFNDVSNAKLQIVADQIGLSQQAFDKALLKLKQPDSELGLIRYERKFLERIDRELKKIQGDILTIRAEGKLVDLAVNRYQIDAIRAHQLIQKAAEKNQVGTISHSDAEQFARQLVEDTANGKTSLTTNEAKRLYHTCNKWGFEQVKVERLLNSIFVGNKWKRRKGQLVAGVLSLLLISVAGGISYGVSVISWNDVFNGDKQSTNATAAADLPTATAEPRWWNETLNKRLNSYAQNAYERSSFLDSLAKNENRESFYKSLTEKAVANQSPHLRKLLSELYFVDPLKSNAQVIFQHATSQIALSNFARPVTSSQIRKSKNALDLLAELVANAISEKKIEDQGNGRSGNVIQFAKNQFGEFASSSSRQSVLDVISKITNFDLWNHAVRFSRSDPSLVAAIVGSIEYSSPTIDELGINELRTRTVQNILTKAPLQWKSIRNSIDRSIENCSPTHLFDWIKILDNTNNPTFSEFLTNSIAKRVGKNDTNQSQLSKRKAIAKFVAMQSFPNFELTLQMKTRLDGLIETHEREFMSFISNGGNQNTSTEAENRTPSLIASQAQLNNLLLAWILAAKGKSNFSNLEALLETKFIKIRSIPEKPNRAPSPSERRRLDESLEKIFNTGRNEVSARITATSDISELAKHFKNISRSNAEKFVEYIFRTKDTREALAVDRLLPKIAHWVQLKLSIADRLENSNDSADSVLSILSHMDIETSELSNESNWQQQIQKLILKNCIETTGNSVSSTIDSARWNELQSIMQNVLLKRLKLLNTNIGSSSRKPFPENWMSGLASFATSNGDNVGSKTLKYLTRTRPRLEQIVGSMRMFNKTIQSLLNAENDNAFKIESSVADELTLERQILDCELELNRTLMRIYESLSKKLEF